MSENVKESENKNTPEIEKIDTDAGDCYCMYAPVILFDKLFLYASLCRVCDSVGYDSGGIV